MEVQVIRPPGTDRPMWLVLDDAALPIAPLTTFCATSITANAPPTPSAPTPTTSCSSGLSCATPTAPGPPSA